MSEPEQEDPPYALLLGAYLGGQVDRMKGRPMRLFHPHPRCQEEYVRGWFEADRRRGGRAN